MEAFERLWRAYARGVRSAPLLTSLMQHWDATPAVVQKNWASKPIALAAKQLWTDFRVATVQPYLTAWRQYAYAPCMALLVNAREVAKAERRRLNTLSFNDLLLLTAEVLRTNASVRRALQREVPLALRGRVPGHRSHSGRNHVSAGGGRGRV